MLKKYKRREPESDQNSPPSAREDPRELPFIAPLMNDNAPTFPIIEELANSMGGIRQLSELERPQTVGDVARAMIGTYLGSSDMA